MSRQGAIQRRQAQFNQIAFQPEHDRFRFRVSKTTVVLDDSGYTIGTDHQAGVQKTREIGVLRRKARIDASGDAPDTVSTVDLTKELSRFRQANTRIHADGGNYL